MVKASNLSWIVVKDIKQAKQFFIEKVGLKELSSSEEFGWVELGGQEDTGAIIGLAEENPAMDDLKAGTNAVITLSVDDIDTSIQHFQDQGIKLIGDVVEVPGHVKMQLFSDLDGNLFQLVQSLD
ncbi:MAG: hypothetical protein S4CHLAM2_18340 [Chlamydiales bacterium]|nr:hypothetical protein [Chlamydiales bacterium]